MGPSRLREGFAISREKPIAKDSDSTVLRSASEKVRPTPAKGERVPVLVVLQGENVNRHYPLVHDESILGRDPESEIALDDSKVSRQHSKVMYSNRGQIGEIPDCRIIDLGSTNGTYLNGNEVLDEDGEWLQDRDRIQIGNTVLGYFLMDQDAVSIG